MLKNIHALLSIMPRVKLSSYNHGKKLVSNLRLTLCLLKTLLIIVQFLKMNQLCNILDFLILTSTETLSSLLKCISARIHTFATHCTLRTYQYPLQRFHCFINLQHPHLSPSSHQNIRKLDENAFRASQGILINCRTGLCLFCQLLLSEIAVKGQPGTKHKPQAE